MHSKDNIKKTNWEAKQTAKELMEDNSYTTEAIEEAFNMSAKKVIHKKKPQKNSKHINNWWNNEIKDFRSRWQRAMGKWKQKRTSEYRKAYNKWNAALRKAIHKSWRKYEHS